MGVNPHRWPISSNVRVVYGDESLSCTNSRGACARNRSDDYDASIPAPCVHHPEIALSGLHAGIFVRDERVMSVSVAQPRTMEGIPLCSLASRHDGCL